MIQSMTGFATSIVEIEISKKEKLSLALSLKSLNSRYFELSCKLPHLLNHFEVNIQRVLKTKLERGHVFLMIKIQQDATCHTIIPAVATIQEYLKAIDTIKKDCKLKDQVSLDTLLQLPNIFRVEEDLLQSTAEEKILQAIDHLADELIKTRQTEGLILAKDVEKNIKEVIKRLKSVQTNSKKLYVQKKSELDLIISQLNDIPAETISTQKSILESKKNVATLELEKIDIHEEIIRANTHAQNIIKLCKAKDSQGKKIDFTLQELNREINTVASKCCDSVVSSLTIDIKSHIEKAREQVQNIV